MTKAGKRCSSGEQPDHNNDFNVNDLLDEILENENKKPWTRKTGRYHPSSLKPGVCQRLLYYDRTGETPVPNIDPGLRMLFGLGHGAHDLVQNFLQSHEGFKAEPVAAVDELNLFGHCDGIFASEDWIIEIKSIGDASFKTLVRPKTEHLWQAHCYMWALDIPRAQVLYINRNTGARRCFRTKFDMEIWEQISSVLEDTEAYVERGEEPPRTVSWFSCRSCKFKKPCNPPAQRKKY
tara:strand:- start:2091 stop:2798 length:708 start_codon:yes stop_codon:yes gene_type:complete